MQLTSAQELSSGEIHIWVARTAVSRSDFEEFEKLLLPDESARAARFSAGRARDTYVVARGLLRCLLGTYLAANPREIPISCTSTGKPGLALDSRVNFNVTHSAVMVAVAVALDCPIGIDLEEIRPLPDLEGIARRFFCPEEVMEILSSTARERECSFFRCWTRKEAFIKAIGDGLQMPLDSFQVSVKPSDLSHLIHLRGDRRAAEEWTLQDLSLSSGYAAAVAYRDRRRSVTVFQVDDVAEFLTRS